MADRYDEALARAAAMIELAADKEEARRHVAVIFPELARPKFRVGDWIVHNKANFVFQVVSIGNKGYEVVNRENKTKTISFDNEVNYHLWSIEDARVGDILFRKDENGREYLELIKSISDGQTDFWFVASSSIYRGVFDGYYPLVSRKDAIPATPAQREQLFSKMREAGLEWDAEKLEPKILCQPEVVEPKFKEGEWIISDNVDDDYHICKVIGIKDDCYVIESIYGYRGYNKFDVFDKTYRPWTIRDARPGDVLTNGDFPCIFKCCDGNGSLYVYCGINSHNDFSILSEAPNNVWSDYPEQYFPATKKQRALLFQKMKEAGYEWLEETKELKKIEQKPAWTEGDEKQLNDIIELLPNLTNRHNWLKSLKGRVQPEQEWNEEDNKMLNSFLHKVEVCNLLSNKENAWIINKLKPLKPHTPWKPTVSQMSQLKWIAHQNADNMIGKELMTLYQDLQKLIE